MQEHVRVIKPLLLASFLALPVWAALADSVFQTNDLASLNLGNVGEFWNNDKPEAHQDLGNFQRAPAFLGGSSFRGKNKAITVVVFRSEAEAVKAMEALRADVASVIQQGETNEFSGRKWWFTSGIPNAVFVNHQNTIVTVSCYQPSLAESGALLRKTAASIIDRIEITAEAVEYLAETNPVQTASAVILNGSNTVLTVTNFVTIKNFILTNGFSQTYCQMYSNNPFFGFAGMKTYLNPDTHQANINCDRSKSDFNTLVIKKDLPTGFTYWDVTWNRERNTLVLEQAWSKTSPDILTKQVESLFKDLLTEIETKKQSKIR